MMARQSSRRLTLAPSCRVSPAHPHTCTPRSTKLVHWSLELSSYRVWVLLYDGGRTKHKGHLPERQHVIGPRARTRRGAGRENFQLRSIKVTEARPPHSRRQIPRAEPPNCLPTPDGQTIARHVARRADGEHMRSRTESLERTLPCTPTPSTEYDHTGALPPRSASQGRHTGDARDARRVSHPQHDVAR